MIAILTFLYGMDIADQFYQPFEGAAVIKPLCAIIFVLALMSCANPLNRRTYQDYIEAGDQAAASGKLELARSNYARAESNAVIGHLSPQEKEAALFKYGRILGNLCRYDEAEEKFIEANRLNEEVNGVGSERTFGTLVEIGQMNYDIGHYEKAVQYFDKALTIAEKYKLDIQYPGSFADAYTDYADALRHTGNNDRAKAADTKAALLKTKASGKEPAYVRYQKACN
jgi:tetratricopeptide (TPR) repeat protein